MEKNPSSPRICIDFDGVLALYSGWKGHHHHGKPMPGAKRFLEELKRSNVDFVVHTSRDSKKMILAWFKKYGLPLPLAITSKKIIATVYIDDRAMYFDGSFTRLLGQLQKFKVHWKEGHPFKDLGKKKIV